MTRTIVTEDVVRAAARRGRAVRVGAEDAVAPGARALAERLGVRLERADAGGAAPVLPGDARVVALGSDHAGFRLKEELCGFLAERGYAVWDFGCRSPDPVDYPDVAAAVARAVAAGEAWRGIVVDAVGVGSAIAANKVAGVRAAPCHDVSSARSSREHNDANVLALGAGLIGPGLAREIVEVWLATEFAGGRHARRVAKIAALESRCGGGVRAGAGVDGGRGRG